MEEYTGFEPQVGEIRALRTFRIGPDGRLYPLYSDRPWLDGANTAQCNVAPLTSSGRTDLATHPAPEPECTCGYYAYGNESASLEHPHARHVLAVIATWGKVIAGTRGIRAEHARIEALWMSDSVPADLTKLVADRYPTTSVYADKSAMLAEHPPTQLDCYEFDPPRERNRKNLALRGAIFGR